MTADALSGGRRLLVRLALGVLAASQLSVGAWALLAPESFFTGFPSAGHAWVATLPPYNEHLTRDVGALSLALTVLLVAATIRADRWSARVTALAFAAYALPHTVFHAHHLEGMPTGDAVGQTVGFVLQLMVVVAVLALTVSRRPNRFDRPTQPPASLVAARQEISRDQHHPSAGRWTTSRPSGVARTSRSAETLRRRGATRGANVGPAE